jgi:hypothetical protein
MSPRAHHVEAVPSGWLNGSGDDEDKQPDVSELGYLYGSPTQIGGRVDDRSVARHRPGEPGRGRCLVIWLLQQPEPIVGLLTVLITVALAILGLVLFRRLVSQTRLEKANVVSEQVFTIAGVLYAVLVAFVVVVVWEDFDQAQTATESEANSIADLFRDSEALPPDARLAVQQSIIAYTKDVVDDEFPRMRRGEAIAQQSPRLTQLWQSYIQAQPVTQSEIAFYKEAISRLDELGNARKTRITTSLSEIPNDLWVLLLGGGAIILIFTYMFSTPDILIHASGVALASALMGFVLYLIFALEHPFVGALSVQPEPYVHVLETWSHAQ